jgi:hypothetical protein
VKRKGTSSKEEGEQERAMGRVNVIKVQIHVYENVIMKPIILYNLHIDKT